MAEAQTLLDCVAFHQQSVTSYYDSIWQLASPEGVFWDQSLHAWVVTSYAHCLSLLQSDCLTQDRLSLPRARSADLVAVAERILNAQLMFSSSEASTEKSRRWTFTLQHGTGYIPPINLDPIVANTISEISSGAEVDIYETLLRPFASRVICGRLGIEEEERIRILPFICQYVRFLDGKLRSEDEFDAAMYSIVALYNKLAPRWRGLPEYEGYERHDWIADLILTLVAGHESTAYLLATVFLHYSYTADNVAEIRSSRLITEALRFDSPVQLIGRRVKTNISIADSNLEAGDKLFLHIGAANRDASVFRDPHEFQLYRDAPQPLSFGSGEGQCLGRNLAIRSASALLEGLMASRLWFEIDRSQTVWDNGLAGRGFRRFPAKCVEL